jgi:hypothetical protein
MEHKVNRGNIFGDLMLLSIIFNIIRPKSDVYRKHVMNVWLENEGIFVFPNLSQKNDQPKLSISRRKEKTVTAKLAAIVKRVLQSPYPLVYISSFMAAFIGRPLTFSLPWNRK